MYKDINFICQFDKKDYVCNSLKFGIAYAKFLKSENKEEAFEDIKIEICELAKAGELQAMAMYLTYVSPNNWDVSVLDLATQIYKKDKKTPEEWEVVAALYCHDIVNVECYNHSTKSREIQTFSLLKLKHLIKSVYNLSDNFFYDKDHYEDSKQYYSDYGKMLNVYQNTKYAKAQERAMMGYYARYFHCGGKVTDASAFYDLSAGVNISLCDEAKIKNKGLPIWKREDFAKKLRTCHHCVWQ